MHTSKIFQIIGYSTDFYIRSRFIGSIKQNKPDREVLGYHGRVNEITNNNIILDNGKKINKGTLVVTECIALCGKVLGTQEQKLETIKKYKSK